MSGTRFADLGGEVPLSDVRYALRAIVRNPGFSLLAGLSLAIGIGANTAIYSVIDAVLLRPLPAVAKPQDLATIVSDVISYPLYTDIRDRAGSFDAVAAASPRIVSIMEAGVARLGRAEVVSGNFFQTLGVAVHDGRALLPADDAPEADSAVAVISHAVRLRRYGPENPIGESILLNGAAFRIVGVAPPGFRGATLGEAPDVWIPIHAWGRIAVASQARLDIGDDGWGWLRVTGRLRSGRDIREATAEVNLIAADRDRAHGRTPSDGLQFANAIEAAAGGRNHADVTRFVILLAAIVGAALLMACANVANLMMVRVTARQKELALRQAIGASPARMVQLLLIEGLALAGASGAAALISTAWTVDVFRAFTLPGGIPVQSLDIRFDSRLLLASLCLTLVTGVVFSLWPALRSARTNAIAALRDGTDSGALRPRARQVLVGVQVAVCLLFVAGAALFGRSIRATMRTDVGFDVDHIAVAGAAPQLQRFDPARTQRLFADARRRVLADPRVRAASWSASLPLSGDRMRETVDVEGYAPKAGESRAVRFNAVGPSYFAAMGIPLRAGRDFDDRDRTGSPLVAVVNETMAARYWPHGATRGRVTLLERTFEVIGVAADSTYEQFGATRVPHVYVALSQAPDAIGAWFIVRTDRDAARLVPLLRDTLAAVAPDVPLERAQTFSDRVAALLMPQRFAGLLLAVFALAALVLAVIGIYGVAAFTVASRRREIGLRVALGAERRDVARVVMSGTIAPVLVGSAAGVAAAMVLARVTAGFLANVSPVDPWSLALATALVVLSAAAASWIPLRRALAVEPAVALRTE